VEKQDGDMCDPKLSWYAFAPCVCLESLDDKVTIRAHFAYRGIWQLKGRIMTWVRTCANLSIGKAHGTRGEEAKKNWSVKLGQLKELGVVFPSAVETLPNRQLPPIAQVRVSHILSASACVFFADSVAQCGHLKKCF